MKRFLLPLIIALIAGTMLGKYSLVELPYSPQVLDELARAGFDVVSVNPHIGIEIVAQADDISDLENRGYFYSVKIDDMESFYASRLDPTLDMGGYRTYDEVVAVLDSLHNAAPNIVSVRDSIGAGWNGYVQWVVKVSDNVQIDEDEPEVLYDATVHAREAIVPEVLIYYIRWLVSNYETDPQATYLVNNREMYFIPIVNPDGYHYNEETNPTGGGMWRKNRRDNGDGTFGVDCNRNFGYMWGYDDTGSSPSTSSETYRGPSAFSEPESQAYRDFVISRHFVNDISYHSYSGMYLYPWGYTVDTCADNFAYHTMAQELAKYNGYVYGPAATTIYPVNGDMIDWMYGDTISKPKIFGISPEVGGSSDGFWPPTDRIVPLCESQLWTNIFWGLASGGAPMVTDFSLTDSIGDGSGYADPGEEVWIFPQVMNKGLQDDSLIYVTATADSGVTFLVANSYIGDIASMEIIDASLPIRVLIDSSAAVGSYVSVILTAKNALGYEMPDTVSFRVGTPLVAWASNFETSSGDFIHTGDWQWGSPSSGPMSAHSGSNLWATRLAGDYSDGTTSYLTTPFIKIPDSLAIAYLSFYHWYIFEGDDTLYDGGNVSISTDGTTFDIIEPTDEYTGTLWSGSPLAGESAFSKSSNGWREVCFDISSYVGDSVRFRWTMASDPYVHYAGWYIDDVSIFGYTALDVSLSDEPSVLPAEIGLSAYPNPFNSSCVISGVPEGARLLIYDLRGNVVHTDDVGVQNFEPLQNGMRLFIWTPDKTVPSGIYLVRLTTQDGQSATKRIVYLK